MARPASFNMSNVIDARGDPFRPFETEQIPISFLSTPMVATSVPKCASPRRRKLRNEHGEEALCTITNNSRLLVPWAGAWLEAQVEAFIVACPE